MTMFMASYKNFTLIGTEGRGKINERNKELVSSSQQVTEYITKCNLICNGITTR